MGRNLFYNLFLTGLLVFSAPVFAQSLDSGTSASVYAYFNVGDSNQDSSLSFDRFQQQIEEIGIGNYTVLPLADLLARTEKGETLPPNTIAITFDEPDSETYSRAFAFLVKNKIPFTVFISPASVDETEWETLANLSGNEFVSIGLSTKSIGPISGWNETQITADLNNAKSIYREKLGSDAKFFSYPAGAYSAAFVDAVRKQGFLAAFGQNSGVVTKDSDRMKLPRFTMTEDFGDLDRFRTTSNAMPFPVTDIQPSVSYVTSFPAIGFTIDPQIAEDDMRKTKCFASGDIQPMTNYLGSGRIEVRFNETPITDRLRINCTIPVAGEFEDDDPRYRWLGFLLYFPTVTPAANDGTTVELNPVLP